MPKISVILGAYNCAPFLGEAIQSIQAQTFTDWEMILCDDGSTDNTYDIAAKYAEYDKRIILLKNDRNRGLSYTLNRCIENAHGVYCARMDGDDLCAPERFEIQKSFLDTHPQYGFCSTTMKRFDERGVYQAPSSGPGYEPTRRDLIKGSPFCHAPSMLRKEAYERVGCYRDIPETLGVEDYDLWFRMFAAGIWGYMIETPLYSMRDGGDAAKRRSYRRRINEARVRKTGYCSIGATIAERCYVLKPLLIGLIPQPIYRILRR